MRVAAIFNRTIKKAINAFEIAGVDNSVLIKSGRDLDEKIKLKKHAFAELPDHIFASEQIDVIVEMTGTVVLAFQWIMQAFAAGKHVVSFNAELDATMGPYLQSQARNSGVKYTLADGDQPGVTLNLYRQVKLMGFKPLVCGNIKGMLDHYRNPETQLGFAKANGLSVDMVTSFADGTKVSLEQASIANATGMQVAKRGMHALRFEGHIDDLTNSYDIDELNELGGIVEMVIGGQPGPGVFVFASTEDPISKRFLEYGKLGKGPLYSFYTPYHLLFFELPFSIARVVDFNDGTLDAQDSYSVEVISTAKTDLKAGTALDGMGGFTCYGQCENHNIVQKEKLLPIALSKGKVLLNSVKKDDVIRWSDVASSEMSDVEKAYHSSVRSKK
jgi:predicted homoserine dehydrogenase-like protein